MTVHMSDATFAELLQNEDFMKEYREWAMSPVAVRLAHALVPFMSPRPNFDSDSNVNYAALHNVSAGAFFALDLVFGLDRVAKKVTKQAAEAPNYGALDLLHSEYGYSETELKAKEK